MTSRQHYEPGPAHGARIEKREGESWTLVLVRELRHSPSKVWRALIEPEQLREWAPFDADATLGAAGATVKLTTVGSPKPHVTETVIKRAEEPKLLEYSWGGGDMRWELEPHGTGTRLTLWTNINRRYIAMGAAGWHVCFDVLDALIDGAPIGRLAGPTAMQVPGWQQLHASYQAEFGVETPSWG